MDLFLQKFFRNGVLLEVCYGHFLVDKKMMHIFIQKQYYQMLQHKQVISSLKVGVCSENILYYQVFGSAIRLYWYYQDFGGDV